MQRNWNSNERGSITAELALAMPAVSLVIAITLGAFALQIERMKLVSVSATAARALARGETEETVRALVFEMREPSSNLQNSFQIEVRDNTVCVTLAREFSISGLSGKFFNFSEVQCARKSGL